MEETMETFNTEMQRVSTCIELLGHDTDSNILKSKMLLWENTGRADIQYLKKLKPDNYLEIWLEGFDNNGTWNEKICKQYYNHKISIQEKEKIRNPKLKKKMNANIKLNNEFIDKNMLIKKEALLHTITNNEQHEIQMIPIDIQNLSDVNNELLKIPIDIQNLSKYG